MPLHDHFRPPMEFEHWESFHSAWANTIVRHLNSDLLPSRYRALPHTRMGSQVESDVITFEKSATGVAAEAAGNGVATAVWAPPQPARTFAAGFRAQDLFEVRVLDERTGRRLVAVVELVSPTNKDRPENRRTFAVKCASHLQAGVAVVVIDVITERKESPLGDFEELLDLHETFPGSGALPLYAVSCRTTKPDKSWRMETWVERLTVGGTLPTLPLWLADNLAIPLRLEESYEETCRVLRLT